MAKASSAQVSRRQLEERRVRERKEALRRLQSGDITPEEKVDLYVRGEFFFPDVVEIRATREQAEADPRIKNPGLVDLDGRLWYVEPDFQKNLEGLREVEQRRRARTARDAKKKKRS